MDQLRRLGDRLDVIETALSVALEEPEPEHRGRLLDALNTATEAVRAEHSEAENTQQNRSYLHLIRGSCVCHPVHEGPAAADPAERSTDQTPAHARRSAG